MTEIGGYKIRLGVLNDIYKIQEVFSDSVRELCKNDYQADTINRWVASKSPESRIDHINNQALWVAEIDDELAGYLITIPSEVIALFVGSSYSRLGIGSALVKLGIELACIEGISDIKLESTITAVPFYRKLGFKEVGRGYFTHGQSELEIPIVNMVLSCVRS